MGWLARIVVILLFVMSAWSIGVMIDRAIAFSGARQQSRQFAPAVAGALRDGKLDEAIKIADRFGKSHLAKVVVAGLQEFKAHTLSAEISGEKIEASKRALERAEAIVHAELKKGISDSSDHLQFDWTTHGSLWNSGRHHQRVQGHFAGKVHRSWRGGGRNFRSAGHHGRGFVRGAACDLGVQLFHESRGRRLNVEMKHQLKLDYFLKRWYARPRNN